MIETKRVEIRDRATFTPAVAMRITGGASDRLMWRCGFGEEPTVILIHLSSQHATWDAFSWGNRTLTNAHNWLSENWDNFKDGGVVDVEFILGETKTPKVSEVSNG